MTVLGVALASLAVLAAACSPGAAPAKATGGGTPGEAELLAAAIRVGGGGQQTGLWASGEGTVSITPDVAVLTMGVEAQRSTVAQARSETAAAMERLFQALRARGLADKDIRTSQFSISPVYRYDQPRQEQVLVGYRVQNVVVAKVRNLKDAGSIIDEAVAAAGDLARVQGIAFTLDNPAPQRDQARSEAVKQAVAKARQMAADAGVALGKVLYLAESGGFEAPQPVILRAQAPGAADSGTPISPGELQVRVTVQIVYEIK